MRVIAVQGMNTTLFKMGKIRLVNNHRQSEIGGDTKYWLGTNMVRGLCDTSWLNKT